MSATADEVLEAMALAFINVVRHQVKLPPITGLKDATPPEHETAMKLARAAIRALPQGWVVAQVSAPIDLRLYKTAAHPRLRGYNAALAAVRCASRQHRRRIAPIRAAPAGLVVRPLPRCIPIRHARRMKSRMRRRRVAVRRSLSKIQQTLCKSACPPD